MIDSYREFSGILEVATYLLTSESDEDNKAGEHLMNTISPMRSDWLEKYAKKNGGGLFKHE